MANVRGHYRKNGSYVRPHTRRNRPGSASPRPAIPRQRSAPGATTNVRGHYRNGSYVRPHTRRISGPVVVAAGGGGLLLLIVVLLALFGGSGEAPAGTSPSPLASTTGAPR
ncbi:hypothetical protein J7E97_16110 [Streptomyces sp. ISL-66]|uniref:hypothetical protein n=1 Tax=Streptomyces sp. ISL-66 TaxID=2819186 RepID=UPI001BEA3DAF|nr:hypothetical protein [Streptomyces sp. ISL-66]MBT2469359.1 hypothetical protein [Streptomyces sp. ISL-66]